MTREDFERAFGDEQRGLLLSVIADVMHARPGMRFDDLLIGKITTAALKRQKDLNDRVHQFYHQDRKVNGTPTPIPARKP